MNLYFSTVLILLAFLRSGGMYLVQANRKGICDDNPR